MALNPEQVASDYISESLIKPCGRGYASSLAWVSLMGFRLWALVASAALQYLGQF